MSDNFLSIDQVKDLVADSTKAAVTEALRAVNTVNPEERAAAPAARGANINLRRYAMPRLGLAMRGMATGQWRESNVFERDLSQAAAEVFKFTEDPTVRDARDPVVEEFGKGSGYRTLIWPKSREEMSEVLIAMGEKEKAQEAAYAARIESAFRAESEASIASGGALVPTQYLQDKFQYALVSMTAVRRAGVESMPVASNVVAMPRESVAAGASTANEAATLSVQDPTFAQQTINVRKQYGYRLWSNELLSDATPAWHEYLANTLVRDVALKQDQQFLEGTGAAPEITGLVNYAGVTAGPSLGANGATPTIDNLIDALYLLRGVNVEPDIAFGNPRTMQTLSKVKDSTGNYILWASGGYNAPSTYNGQIAGQFASGGLGRNAVLLNQLDFFFSNQMLTNRTVGTSVTATDLVITNRRNLLIIERQGIEVAYSEHVAFNSDQTAARAIGRAAIVALQPAGVEVITGILP